MKRLSEQPPTDIPLLGIEPDTDFHDFAPVGLVRNQLAFVVYLLQCFFGRAAQFKLEDVDVFGCLDHGIGTSAGTLHFGPGVLPHEFEDKIKDHLVVAFRLRVQLVREVGKESLQAGKEGVDVATAQFLYEFADIEILVAIRH